jgi:hypothetical protein
MYHSTLVPQQKILRSWTVVWQTWIWGTVLSLAGCVNLGEFVKRMKQYAPSKTAERIQWAHFCSMSGTFQVVSWCSYCNYQWTLHGLFYLIPTITLCKRQCGCFTCHLNNCRSCEVSQLTQGRMASKHPNPDSDQIWQSRISVISKVYNISHKSNRSLAGQSKVQNFRILLCNTLLAIWGYWISKMPWLSGYKG